MTLIFQRFVTRFFGVASVCPALICAFLICVPFVASAEGRKLALVVGNEAYEYLPGLATPAADAQEMSKSLRDLGFEVTLLTDVGPEVFQAVLGSFADQSKDAETVLFYYSGHAFQKGGVNHLVPVNARLQDAGSVDRETWRLNDIAAQLKSGPGQLLMFIDACRDNPVPDAVQGASDATGLAQFDGGAGTFVAFATSPGSVAFDSQKGSKNSPFTSALLGHIAAPQQSISDLMIAVRNDVTTATGGKQTPWEQSSLREQFFFNQLTPVLSAETAETALFADMPEFEDSEQTVLLAAVDDAEFAGLAGSVEQIAGVPIRLAALNSETRSLGTVGGVQAGALHLKGADAGAKLGDLPDDLPLAVQGELARIGCYAMAVDGDWGNGSRRAMETYYAAKKAEKGEVEPSAAVYWALAKEPAATCKAPAAVIKKEPTKAAAKKSTPKKPVANKPVAKKATTKKAAPAAKKDGVTCKFLVIAVVCN